MSDIPDIVWQVGVWLWVMLQGALYYIWKGQSSKITENTNNIEKTKDELHEIRVQIAGDLATKRNLEDMEKRQNKLIEKLFEQNNFTATRFDNLARAMMTDKIKEDQ